MSEHNIQRLFEKYPGIFPADVRSPPLDTGHRIHCPDGWFPIVDALCEALQCETDENGAPQLVAPCVKEKFGTLRFQALGPRSERQDAMIDLAWRISARLDPDG